jgi:Rrf2 family protein
MLSLSQTVGYAIRALGCIASAQGDRVLSTQIHQCTGISVPYLRKVLCVLSKAGLIHARRGQRGGFVLSRPATEITLLDVMHATGTACPVPACPFELPGCPDDAQCPMHSFWQKERTRIEAKLASVTVADEIAAVLASRGRHCAECAPQESPNPRTDARDRRPTRGSRKA